MGDSWFGEEGLNLEDIPIISESLDISILSMDWQSNSPVGMNATPTPMEIERNSSMMEDKNALDSIYIDNFWIQDEDLWLLDETGFGFEFNSSLIDDSGGKQVLNSSGVNLNKDYEARKNNGNANAYQIEEKNEQNIERYKEENIEKSGLDDVTVDQKDMTVKMRNVRGKYSTGSNSSTLNLSILSQYFMKPIATVSKELKIGMTMLKKRCREVGIYRWPHRKLKSLVDLLKNMKDLHGEDHHEIKEKIEIIEKEIELILRMPGAEVGEETMKLRQECFKATHKRRKKNAEKNSNNH